MPTCGAQQGYASCRAAETDSSNEHSCCILQGREGPKSATSVVVGSMLQSTAKALSGRRVPPLAPEQQQQNSSLNDRTSFPQNQLEHSTEWDQERTTIAVSMHKYVCMHACIACGETFNEWFHVYKGERSLYSAEKASGHSPFQLVDLTQDKG